MTAALDAVSVKLDAQSLTRLDDKVVSQKRDPRAVAADWLASAGLG